VNGTSLLTGVIYDPFGPPTAWSWGNGTSTVSRIFDQDGNPKQIVTDGVTNAYTVDAASRITQITDSGLSSDTWNFTSYDSLDRIKAASSSAKSRGYTYDANSNRLTTTGTTASTETVSTTSNQLNATSGGVVRTYTYDAAGNTKSFTGTTFTFNQRGRMSAATVSAGTTNYVYNAIGQLIEKSGNGGTTLLVYDETGHLLGEYSSSGALIQETIWMGNLPVATLRPGGSTVAIYYVHTDHLGAPRKITQPSNNALMWRWDPDTYGSVAPTASGLTYNLRFPGQYALTETGLYYNMARDYDPAMGRYLESDPIGLAGGVNPYAYVAGNPVSFIDPLGLCSSNQSCIPRPVVISWICQLLAQFDFNVQKASVAAYNMRIADNGNNDNPIWREGENWLTAAAWNHWYDPQHYTMNYYLWQSFKHLPGAKEPYSQDALEAGLDGHQHASDSKDQLKQWCKDCDKN
jgi:RHS repeat-associated protein